MNIDRLSVEFYRGFEKEFFRPPKNSYLNYKPWDLKQRFGTYPKAMFQKKDPTCFIRLKNTDLWLYEKDNEFKFMKIHMKEDGFDLEQPLLFWVDYLKEPTFLLYKIVGFGIPRNYFLKYNERDGKIVMNWVTDMKNCTVFSQNDNVKWWEYNSDLVGYRKRF